jgi:predicted enzyme related to lactoylglutathione lyase
MSPIITTFEINASDLNRAARFYSALLGREVPITEIGGEQAGLLSAERDPVLGVIRCAPDYARPSDQGTNVYFRVEDDLEAVLARVELLGGKLVVPLMEAGEFGQFAWILDSEGNRIGLNRPLP